MRRCIHTILIPYTCTHIGKDIRERLDEHVIQLYNDLIGGFSHLAWLLPGWLPLPSFRLESCTGGEKNG